MREAWHREVSWDACGHPKGIAGNKAQFSWPSVQASNQTVHPSLWSLDPAQELVESSCWLKAALIPVTVGWKVVKIPTFSLSKPLSQASLEPTEGQMSTSLIFWDCQRKVWRTWPYYTVLMHKCQLHWLQGSEDSKLPSAHSPSWLCALIFSTITLHRCDSVHWISISE